MFHKLKNHFNKSISTSLERLNIYITILFTIITGTIAIATCNTVTTVKNMDDLLIETQQLAVQNSALLQAAHDQLRILEASSKPYVGITHFEIEQSDTVTTINTNYTNYGGRPAVNLDFRLWILKSNDVIAVTRKPSNRSASPHEEGSYMQGIGTELLTKKQLLGLPFVVRINYIDILTKAPDSVTTYGRFLIDPFGRYSAAFLDSTEILKVNEFIRSRRNAGDF